jgi:hypothetical protein
VGLEVGNSGFIGERFTCIRLRGECAGARSRSVILASISEYPIRHKVQTENSWKVISAVSREKTNASFDERLSDVESVDAHDADSLTIFLFRLEPVLEHPALHA